MERGFTHLNPPTPQPSPSTDLGHGDGGLGLAGGGGGRSGAGGGGGGGGRAARHELQRRTVGRLGDHLGREDRVSGAERSLRDGYMAG